MTDIDEMDVIGYLQVRQWEAKREKKKKEPKKAYIDQVWRMDVNI